MSGWNNKALDGAYRKGRAAYIDGATRESCPYIDYRTVRGGVTFSRAFAHAWTEGWDDASKEDVEFCKTMNRRDEKNGQ